MYAHQISYYELDYAFLTAFGEFKNTLPFVGVVDFLAGFFLELFELTDFYELCYFFAEFTNDPELFDGLITLGPLSEFFDDDFESYSK